MEVDGLLFEWFPGLGVEPSLCSHRGKDPYVPR